MKRFLLLAACLLALPPAVSAQSAVPGMITYQGKVTDAAGALIGSPTPVNRAVIFRVYDHGTAVAVGNRLHTEQQTVTIANGEFNVLVGAGSAVSGEAFVTALDTVFTGASRYLGVTVDDGNAGTVDPEISPRQQIVTMPYAFRAKVAESVVGSAATSNIFQTSGNVGIGTNAPAAPLTLFSSASDAKFLLQTPGSGATGTDGLALVQSNAGYLLQYEALPLHLGTSAAVRMTVAANGNVGIGTQTPGTLLSLGGALGNTKLALWDDAAGSFYGMGIQASQFRFHTAGTGERFSFLGGANGNEVFTIKSTGQVGIGITTPIVPLQIYTADASSIMLQHAGTGTTLQSGLALIESNKGYLWQYSNLPLLIGTNGTTRMTFTADGKVAIGGGENPGALLSLGGATTNTKLALWDNEAGSLFGLGMGAGGQMRFHTNSATDRFSFLSNAASTSEVFTVASNGKIGIGVASPVSTLQMLTANDSRISLQVTGQGTTTTDGLSVIQALDAGYLWQFENLRLRLGTNNIERFQIGANGRMAFNSANLSDLSDATDYTYIFKSLPQQTGTGIMAIQDGGGNTQFVFFSNGTAYKPGGGTWSSSSDLRLKTEVNDLTGSLDRLLKLRSVSFRYKDPQRHGAGLHNGFVAQEVEKVFPDWVTKDDNDMRMVGPRGFESLTVQALRELRAEKDAALAERDRTIAAQDARIHDLEAQAKAADARMAAFERKLALSLAAVTANSPR